MPTRPNVTTLKATQVDILNAIRNNASANYRDYVPVADASAESVREIGAIIMNYPALQNEFLNALVNRIGLVLIKNKSYSNPWQMFKQGMLEMGETVEEIFVNIAKPFEFDPETAEREVFKREIPDVRAAFHIINYQKFYKATVSREQLRKAFLSANGLLDLVSKIVQSMYSGSAYDEWLTMKYLLALNILRGRLYAVTVAQPTADNAKSVMTVVKGASNNLEFLSPKYTAAGVYNSTEKADQYFIAKADFDATVDVEVLAAAFNMDKAEFTGHRVTIDSFGSLDIDRLDILFAKDPNYVRLTSDELAALDAIPAVLVDRDWFMIFDNLFEFTEQYNGEGLYWNYWYHAWKTFSVSPFHPAVVFVPGTPSVTSITISPSTATVAAGQKVNLTATVVTENFAPQTVIWESSDEDIATVDIYGTVTTVAGASGDVTITATSTFDSTVTATATITVE